MRKHPSCLEMQVKDPVYKNLFIVPSAVAMSKWWRFGRRARKKEVGDWCENGSNEKGSKCNHHPVKSGLMSLMSARDSLVKPRERSCD